MARTNRPAELSYTGHWWFEGSEQEWKALPVAEREQRSLAATGCLLAWPSWEGPVECVHVGCQIARGELPKIARVNAQLRGEAESGWLRFVTDRKRLAAIFRAHRRVARETGAYDIWSKEAWALTVYGGLGG